MKKTVIAAIAAVFVVLCSALPAQAQFRFGVKVGCDVNSLHFDSSLLDSDNRAGFTGGVMAQFTAPMLGLGFDISAMYVRRNLNTEYTQTYGQQEYTGKMVSHRDYIEIPVNLKYMLSIPAVSKIVKPFVTTGPSVAFLTSRTGINDAFKNKQVDCTWNFGFGVELVNKLQLAASYGLGLSNSVVSTLTNDQVHQTEIDGKTRCWTVTAAWMF